MCYFIDFDWAPREVGLMASISGEICDKGYITKGIWDKGFEDSKPQKKATDLMKRLTLWNNSTTNFEYLFLQFYLFSSQFYYQAPVNKRPDLSQVVTLDHLTCAITTYPSVPENYPVLRL
jgi:hypothetical protein